VNIAHLSYSSLQTYLACGQAWNYRYVQKITSPTGPALAFGSAWHATVEALLRGDTRPAAEVWMEQWSVQVVSPQFPIAWGDENPGVLAQDGLRMLAASPVRALIAQMRPGRDAQGLLIERKVTLRVPEVEIPVIGYVDLIAEDGVPGDIKTAARMWADDKAEHELQPLFYLAALDQAGVKVPGWRFRHYVFTKTAKPDARCFTVAHNPNEVEWLTQVVQEAWRGICAGVFHRNFTTWMCSARYCAYWSLCRGKHT